MLVIQNNKKIIEYNNPNILCVIIKKTIPEIVNVTKDIIVNVIKLISTKKEIILGNKYVPHRIWWWLFKSIKNSPLISKFVVDKTSQFRKIIS